MANSEQEEEREVLTSIYDGDPAFRELSPKTYQYKCGIDGDRKSFLVELTWGENYPNEPPQINMETFYNKPLSETLKSKVVKFLDEEASALLGGAMTFSLFEAIKDKLDYFFEGEDEASAAQEADASKDDVEVSSDNENAASSKKAPKKEQLTKAQKRKQWDRMDNKGEKPRGWDWIDVIHHLSSTGPKVESSSTT
ncbi:unnamed protein product [Nesidiocoris tenuis]|uniref:RWD domain-containing protein n=1 Tax=Nesidiocoris tenuis TaxID=355587 RepID=A0A6H5GDM8_9HEMI|nr:unnamed protein product [Nesidiocoris tenuis]